MRKSSHPSVNTFVEDLLQQTEQAYATRYQVSPEAPSVEAQIHQLATQNQQPSPKLLPQKEIVS